MRRITVGLLTALCIVTLAPHPARAQYAEDLGDIFLSFSETERVPTQDVGPFVAFDFYLMVEITYADIGRPSEDPTNGIIAWEASIALPAEITVIGRVLNPPQSVNVGGGLDNWIVGTGVLVSAASTPFTIVHYTGLLLGSGSQFEDLTCTIGAATPSSFDRPGGPGLVPGWAEYLETGECPNNCLRGFARWNTRMVVNCVDEPECAVCEKGDVIVDGEINSADAIRALFFAVGLIVPTPDELCAADMNSDGAVDEGDVVQILRAAVGIPAASTSSAFSAPRLTARPGEALGDVILHVENAAGLDLVMTYDPRAARFVSASAEGSRGVVAVNGETPGRLRLGFAKATSFEGDLLLRFEVANPHGSLRFVSGSAFDEQGATKALVLSNPELFFGATGVDPVLGAAASTRFLAAVPNPFNPSTQLRFALAEPGDARLEIFDAAGRRVRTFDVRGLAAGEHSVTFDGRDDNGGRVASGVYLVRLLADGRADTGRILMLK